MQQPDVAAAAAAAAQQQIGFTTDRLQQSTSLCGTTLLITCKKHYQSMVEYDVLYDVIIVIHTEMTPPRF